MKKRWVFGQWQDNTPLSADEVFKICQQADLKKTDFAQYPLDLIFELLEKLKEKWSDPGYSYRLQATEVLPGLTGFSRPMIELAMNHLGDIFSEEALRLKLQTELNGIARTGGYHFDYQRKTLLKYHPLGSVLHILAGNVFLVGPGALVQGLITGNLSILKLASEETFFMPLFMQSLIECEKELGHSPAVSESVCLLNYSSQQSELIEVLKNNVDGIAIWGGEQAVKTYRNNLPARTRAIVFGPKLSFAYVSALGLKEQGAETSARKLAEQLAIWDQNACTAPQICLVEGQSNALAFAENLNEALKEKQKNLPLGFLTPDQAAEIQKTRTVFEIAEAKGEAKLFVPDDGSLHWTVCLDQQVALNASPLFRTIRVVAVTSPQEFKQLKQQMQILRSYVQTIGVIGSAGELVSLANEWGALGALRVVSLEEMHGGAIDDPHDGAYDLPQFLNLTVSQINNFPDNRRYFELLPENEKEKIRQQRLRETFRQARKAPYYRENLPVSWKQWSQLPVLSRTDLEKNMPPASKGLQAKDYVTGGQITRSGGSTGSPKFSWFDKTDWQNMVDSAIEVFRASGFNQHDKVVNAFLSGDLYGSFLSVNDVNAGIGLTSFPTSGKLTADLMLYLVENFAVNTLQAVPSLGLPILREAKKLNPKLNLRKFLYAGEPLSVFDRQWLQRELQTEVIASIIGTTEAGVIAYQSTSQGDEHFRLVSEYNHLELVDEDGQAVEDGSKGRILVSSLMKKSFPVIRYDIGDAGRFIPGSQRTLMTYLGRHDDIIVMGLENIAYQDVVSAFDGLPFSEIQLEAELDTEAHLLQLNIETESPSRELQEKAEEQLREKIPSLFEHAEKKYLKMQFNLVKTGTLERNPRSGKLKKILDRRTVQT